MSINPDDLEKWDSREPMTNIFDKQFSLDEKVKAHMSGTGASMGDNAHFDARQTLSGIAAMYDHGSIDRAWIRTEGDQEAIVVDLVHYKGASAFRRSDNPDMPLILARVAYYSLATEEGKIGAKSVQATMPTEGIVQGIKAGCREELTVLINFLNKNRRLLSKEFLKKFEKDLPRKYFRVSGSFSTFVSPLYTGKLDRVCSKCGIFGKQMLCSRCKLVRYCSPECQHEDWKRHTVECVHLSKLDISSQDYVEVDPARMKENVLCATINHKNSWGLMSLDVNDHIYDQNNAMNGMETGKVHVMKVQVLLNAKIDDPSDICIYTKDKQFIVHAIADIFKEGVVDFKKLFQLVKDKGDDCGYGAGGVKLFLYGFATEDKKLRLLMHNVLPFQAW